MTTKLKGAKVRPGESRPGRVRARLEGNEPIRILPESRRADPQEERTVFFAGCDQGLSASRSPLPGQVFGAEERPGSWMRIRSERGPQSAINISCRADRMNPRLPIALRRKTLKERETEGGMSIDGDTHRAFGLEQIVMDRCGSKHDGVNPFSKR